MNRPILFAITMLVPVLFLGAVTEEGLLATAIAVVIAAAWIHLADLRGHWSREGRIGAIALWGLAAWEALQLVPLPPWLLRVLSPRAAALWAESDLSFARTPGWHPITLDPHATAFMATTATVVAAFFVTACRYSLRSAGRVRLVRSIVGVVLAFDAVSLLHPILGFDELYGLVESKPGMSSSGLLLTPLINPNHAAALSAVAPPLLLGIAMEAETASGAAVATIGAVASAVMCVLDLSRGGMAVLACELAAVGAYALARRGGYRRRLGGVGIAIVTAVGAVAAPMYVAIEPLTRETHDTNLTKLRIVAHAARMIPDFALVGVGRGAFASTFAGYESALDGMLRFTYVESWPAQLTIDLGIPAAAAFIGALAWATVRSARSSVSRPTTFTALVALIGLLLHDLVDFSMEFAGVAMVAAALAAVALTNRPALGPSPANTPRGLWLRAAPPALVALAPLLLIPQWHHDVDTDARTLAETWGAGRLAETEPSIVAAANRHPADPYFPMIEGIRRLQSVEAAPFLLRAVKLGPSRPNAHFWLARWFVSAHRPGQAWAEYREAMRLSRYFQGAVLDDMIAFGAPIEDIIAVTLTGDDLDEAAERLANRGRLPDAALADEANIERFPPAVKARVRQIARAMAAGDAAFARAQSAELLRLAPDRVEAYLSAAAVAATPESAEDALVTGLRRAPNSIELLQELVRRRGSRLGLGAVTSELARLRSALLVSVGHAERAWAVQGEVELARGRPAAAIAAYLEAAELTPEGDDYLETAAAIAESSDQLSMAVTLYAQLLERHPQEPRFAAALARVRERIAQRGPPAYGEDAGTP